MVTSTQCLPWPCLVVFLRARLSVTILGSRSTRSSVQSLIAAAGSPPASSSTMNSSSIPPPASGNVVACALRHIDLKLYVAQLLYLALLS